MVTPEPYHQLLLSRGAVGKASSLCQNLFTGLSELPDGASSFKG